MESVTEIITKALQNGPKTEPELVVPAPPRRPSFEAPPARRPSFEAPPTRRPSFEAARFHMEPVRAPPVFAGAFEDGQIAESSKHLGCQSRIRAEQLR